MKSYRLLKDLPFAKAGNVFKITLDDGLKVLIPKEWTGYRHKLVADIIKDFDEWFEEVEDKSWAINTLSSRVEEIANTFHSDWAKENLESLGLLFSTKEEAKKHLEWLKARAVLLKNCDERNIGKYNVIYDENEGFSVVEQTYYSSEINFWTAEAALASVNNHEKEWKIYLGIED